MNALLKTTGIGMLILFGALASGAAMADRDGHHDHDGHGDRDDRGYAQAYHHGYGRGFDHDEGRHVRFGVSFGMPFYDSGFYSPFYGYPYPVYSAPPVVVQSTPPVYVEQSAAPTAPPPAYWYYCAAARTYYPYVSECPAGWQRVPAQPPR